MFYSRKSVNEPRARNGRQRKDASQAIHLGAAAVFAPRADGGAPAVEALPLAFADRDVAARVVRAHDEARLLQVAHAPLVAPLAVCAAVACPQAESLTSCEAPATARVAVRA